MKKVILIHGYTSSPKRKKYQLISVGLDKLGIDHAIPALPGTEHPHSKKCLESIDQEVKNAAKPVVLVGHSLGTRAILLYLDAFKRKVDSVILIAAFNNEVEKNRKRNGGKYADFFGHPVDVERVRKRAHRFIVAHSKDDDTIDYKQGAEIAEQLGAELRTYRNRGHFSGEKYSEENARIFLQLIKSVL